MSPNVHPEILNYEREMTMGIGMGWESQLGISGISRMGGKFSDIVPNIPRKFSG